MTNNEKLYRRERELSQEKERLLLLVRGDRDEIQRKEASQDLSANHVTQILICKKRLNDHEKELKAVDTEIQNLIPLLQAARHGEHLDEIRGRRDGYAARATKHIDRIRELEKLLWEEKQQFAKMRTQEEFPFQEQFKKELQELRPKAHLVEAQTRRAS